MKNALIRMRESLDIASPAEREIITRLLAQPALVMEHSIHSLAEVTFSSPSTILRTCRKLGFEGYKDFRRAVTYELALRRQSEAEERKEITRADSLQEIAEKVTSKNIFSLEDTRNLLDHGQLEKCIELMGRCRAIYLFGMGSSLIVAHDAYLKFLRLGKPCVVNDDWHSQLLQARNMAGEDLGVVLSYSGQTVEMVECMKAMRENRAKIISITRYASSPVSELADINLYVASNESLFRSGAMSSRISQLNMVDILYTGYANRFFEESLQQLSRTHIHKPQNTPVGAAGRENAAGDAKKKQP